MEIGLKHEEVCQVLKTEQEKHPSPRGAVHASQWDSVESDTESLAQERAYKQQHGDVEDEDANVDESLQVYDSLEVAAQPHAKKNRLLQTAYSDTQIDERKGTR